MICFGDVFCLSLEASRHHQQWDRTHFECGYALTASLPTAPSSYSGTSAYQYDGHDQLKNEQSSRLGSYTNVFNYDGAGNPTTFRGVAQTFNIDNQNNATTFDGEGTSAQSNALTGSISVTVAKRLVNGNLLVRGQKWLTINQGREYVKIQGIVRPVDIGPDNTVASTMVADAVIAYGGTGTLADANTKGWLARFFDSKWMPF